MMIDIALAGGGVGIFPEPMVRAEVASGALVELTGMRPLAPVEFHVAMRVADTEPVLVRIFEQAARLRIAPGLEVQGSAIPSAPDRSVSARSALVPLNAYMPRPPAGLHVKTT